MPDISYPAGGREVPGYLARPTGGSGPSPGLVVIHEAFGLTADIRAHADELARNGYLALAPDLYEGKSWIRCIRAVFGQLRAGGGAAFGALDSARRYLAGDPECTGRVGVIGFCVGGGFALLCAPRDGFAVASVNDGDVPRDAADVLAGSCPVVGSFGGRDPMGTGHPERLERALSALDVPHDVKIYPQAGHRFLTESAGAAGVLARIARMPYRRDDAADAWQRIYAFFGEHLAGPDRAGRA